MFGVINNVLSDSIRFRHAFIICGVISHCCMRPGGKRLADPGALGALLSLEIGPQPRVVPLLSLFV